VECKTSENSDADPVIKNAASFTMTIPRLEIKATTTVRREEPDTPNEPNRVNSQ
ncbi:unnamed protein product, partial [Acidithrix sp. C25]